jgi:hypothetical protein
MTKIKLVKMQENFGTAVSINQAKKAFAGELNTDLLEALKVKMATPKWQSVIVRENESSITLHSKKKSDLGVDSMNIYLVANQFVIAKKSFSNNNNTETTYFQIQH